MMRPKAPVLSYFLVVSVLFLLLTNILGGCANIIPPTGGPRDSIPPKIVAINPLDSTLNFRGNRLTIEFDEYIALDKIQENLLVSPTPKVMPIVESRLKTLTVKIKDTLQPNTTYVIDFGEAIRDINENNALKGFRYIFSTGSTIDSMQLAGNVMLAETGKVDSTLIVMLYQDLTDSAVVKEKPRYYTRVDNKGNFLFQNLAPGTYAIYALKDESASRRYLSPSQLFAFANQPVVIDGKSAPLSMLAYLEPEKEKEKKKAKPAPKQPAKDKEQEQDKRLKYTTTLMAGGQQDILQPLGISFASPLKEFDSTKLHFTDDQGKAITNYRLERDSTNTNFTLRYDWPIDQAFKLVLEKGLATDSTGKSILRSDTLAFRTMKESDYGSVRFRFTNVDTSRNPVLQMVQNDKVVYSYAIRGKELFIKRFKPAEFELRILFDDNQNGKWDPGDFFGTKRQPERAKAIPKKLTIKGNWDNEIDISL